MPEFGPGSSHKAIVTMSNPKDKAFDYDATLYMGVNQVAMAGQPFHLEAGESKDISLPVVMPTTLGSYPVYLDVSSGGVLLKHYRATEDVVILAVAPGVTITGASWELVEYPYTGYWPEETGPLTAYFCKCTIGVQSDSDFIGTVKITCPYTISAVPLLTEAGRQRVLDEIDEKIATSTGAIKELWQNRKAIFLSYPQVNGFFIDFRWYASADPDSQNSKFRSWIGSMADSLTLTDVVIPAGTSTVQVGFFKLDGTALIHPATIEIYDDSTLAASIVSDLVPFGEMPILMSIDLPSSVVRGESVPVSLVMHLPELMEDQQSYYWTLRAITGLDEEEESGHEIAKADYASSVIAVPLMAPDRCGRTVLIPLNAPDNLYTIQGIWDDYEWTTASAPLSPGTYQVVLRGVSWRLGPKATGCGYYVYGLKPAARYNFGIVGYLVVT